MSLVLAAVALFALIGLASRRFGPLQHALIVAVSLALVVIQFAFPRFL